MKKEPAQKNARKRKKSSGDSQPDIVYGEGVGLTEEDFNPRNIKQRVTMYLDQDLIEAARSAKDPRGYQPFINDKLREVIFGEKGKDAVYTAKVETEAGAITFELKGSEDPEKVKALFKAFEAAQSAIYDAQHGQSARRAMA